MSSEASEDYETARQRRIEANNAFLLSLGLITPTQPKPKPLARCKTDPIPFSKKRLRRRYSHKDENSDDEHIESLPRARSVYRSALMSQPLPEMYHPPPVASLLYSFLWKRESSQEKHVSCHQCRQRSQLPKLSCTNIIDGVPCNKYWDKWCLASRYDVDPEAVDLSTWVCPFCSLTCNCSFCRRRPEFTPIQVARFQGIPKTADEEFFAKHPHLRPSKSLHRSNRRGHLPPSPQTTDQSDVSSHEMSPRASELSYRFSPAPLRTSLRRLAKSVAVMNFGEIARSSIAWPEVEVSVPSERPKFLSHKAQHRRRR
ncbi:hypothetical protein IWQ61_010607 [Dispira simplex]|nr:hypothetical protein IWQ61_010607 [Dispira simplex]